jgi:mannose-6-phosphate isomerase-like protein (cupin superfamily)
MEKRLFSRGAEIDPTIYDHGRQSRLMISPKFMDAKGIAMGYQVMAPGGKSPVHTHEKEQESFFFYRGRGKVILGDKEFEVGPETAYVAPPGVPHGIINTGDEEIRFVWVFFPPLPVHLE